jgi:hypothetical protein
MLDSARTKLVAAILLVTAFGIGAWLLWQQVAPRMVGSAEYRVDRDDITVEPPAPAWIDEDIRAAVFRSIEADGPPSTLDDDLTVHVAEAFADHPWVARVVEVRKSHPDQVHVKLKYRRPACLVELPEGLVAVDGTGVVLPTGRIMETEAARCPRLVGIAAPPLGAAGEAWGDPRVHGAAEIAAAVRPYGESWHITRIIASPAQSIGALDRTEYSLLCEDGTRIVWGLAPGASDAPAPDTEEKIARLKAFFAARENEGAADSPPDIDVRALPGRL